MKWLWRIFPRRLVKVGEADIGEGHLGTRVGERYRIQIESELHNSSGQSDFPTKRAAIEIW